MFCDISVAYCAGTRTRNNTHQRRIIPAIGMVSHSRCSNNQETVGIHNPVRIMDHGWHHQGFTAHIEREVLEREVRLAVALSNSSFGVNSSSGSFFVMPTCLTKCRFVRYSLPAIAWTVPHKPLKILTGSISSANSKPKI